MGEVAELNRESEIANGNGGAAAGETGGHEPLDGEDQGIEQEAPKKPPLELEGKGKQLSLKITGDTPDKATAKMVGGKIDIPAGEYQPGDVIETVCRMRCVEVGVIDKMNNATGEVNERERVHKFKLMQIERVE